MIFESVSHIKSKEEFIEKILVYIRLVEVIAERDKIIIPEVSYPSDDMIKEMIDMGVLSSGEDITALKKALTTYYNRFMSALSFYIEHRQLYGNYLDKLNNKKRKELQDREALLQKPKMVDFFAGAGGLSCGFTQAGYRVCFANDFEDVCIRTYKYNHPELPSDKVLKEDIRRIVNNISIFMKFDLILFHSPVVRYF